MPEFKIKISAEVKQFAADIGSAVNCINNFASSVQGRLGALLGAGGLARAAKETIDFASRFNDSAKKLGVGVEFLQEAAFAAKQTGAELSDVEMALKRLQVAQVSALGGNAGLHVLADHVEHLRRQTAGDTHFLLFFRRFDRNRHLGIAGPPDPSLEGPRARPS